MSKIRRGYVVNEDGMVVGVIDASLRAGACHYYPESRGIECTWDGTLTYSKRYEPQAKCFWDERCTCELVGERLFKVNKPQRGVWE